MNNRIWLGPLLLILATIALLGTATAQFSSRPAAKQSHHDLPNALDMANAQEMMALRLQELHELHQWQDQVQGLLQNRDFLDQIRARFTESDLQKLQARLHKGEGLRGDRNWNQLLQQAASHQRLDDKQIELLHRLTESGEHKQPAPSPNSVVPEGSGPSSAPPAIEISPPMPAPSTIQPTPNAPEPSPFDRVQQETSKWLVENLDNVGSDIVEALIEMKAYDDNTPFAELLHSLQQPDFSRLNVSERTIGLSNFLSDAGDFLHQHSGSLDEVRSFLRNTAVPSLPNLPTPSVSLPSSADSAERESWSPAVLLLLLLGLIILLLSLRSLGSKAQAGSGDGDEWRLGSWPVSPDRVSTRQDVIRAFEYLALLCLGSAASACHHRELAERLAEQDSDDPARRQAAEMLAWTYEQARYAPDGEALSPEQLSDARHALCLLAGVTAV